MNSAAPHLSISSRGTRLLRRLDFERGGCSLQRIKTIKCRQRVGPDADVEPQRTVVQHTRQPRQLDVAACTMIVPTRSGGALRRDLGSQPRARRSDPAIVPSTAGMLGNARRHAVNVRAWECPSHEWDWDWVWDRSRSRGSRGLHEARCQLFE